MNGLTYGVNVDAFFILLFFDRFDTLMTWSYPFLSFFGFTNIYNTNNKKNTLYGSSKWYENNSATSLVSSFVIRIWLHINGANISIQFYKYMKQIQRLSKIQKSRRICLSIFFFQNSQQQTRTDFNLWRPCRWKWAGMAHPVSNSSILQAGRSVSLQLQRNEVYSLFLHRTTPRPLQLPWW